MRDSAAGNNGFVITKHDGPAHGNTKAAKSEAKINNLVSCCLGCHKFRTTCGGFDGVLFCAVEINDGLICKQDIKNKPIVVKGIVKNVNIVCVLKSLWTTR